MKPIGRVGVSVLLLLVLATPMIACLIPAIVMTAAERDCCKRMAGECHKGMAQSHSCCQTVTVPGHLAAIKGSPVLNGQHPTMLVARQVHPD
jgi:hypothetical protein